jgi:murein DD-endopeptidase MepM/ murein hydrolase activator NlpD
MKRAVIFAGLIFIICSSICFAFPVSSRFGWRINPINGKEWEFHTGIDIPAQTGSPILAIFDGKVIHAGPYRGYGLAVILHHPKDNSYTLYGHCSKVLVKKAQKVNAGEQIALVGSTGISTGPHLHLAYWRDNRYIDPMTIWTK